MNETFELRKTRRSVRNQYKLNLEVPFINQVTFRAKSIRYLRSKIWSSLPFYIKSSESLTTWGPGIRSHENTLSVSARVLLI